LIWLDSGSEQLGVEARTLTDRGLAAEGLALSAISFWEAGTLQRKGRISLGLDLDSWRSQLLQAGVSEIAVSGDIAARAAALEEFHGDPADRIIVATALREGAELLTADGRILKWSGSLLRRDARV